MESERKHAIILICSGIIGISSLSLPWADGMSLLQIYAVNEVTKAFPETSLSLAVSGSQIAATYITFYSTFIVSSSAIVIGILQFYDYHGDYRWIRLLTTLLYGGTVLLSMHFPAYPAQFGRSSFGFYLFVSPLVLFLLSEYLFGEKNTIQDIVTIISNRAPFSRQEVPDFFS